MKNILKYTLISIMENDTGHSLRSPLIPISSYYARCQVVRDAINHNYSMFSKNTKLQEPYLPMDLLCICIEYLTQEINDDYHSGFRVNDYRQGEWIHWYWGNYRRLNKKVAEQGRYINGKRDGLWKRFHNNGNLHIHELYVDGKENGEVKVWLENGKLIGKYEYVNGKQKNGCLVCCTVL